MVRNLEDRLTPSCNLAITGLSIVGISVPFVGTYRAPFFAGITQAVLTYVITLVVIFALALLANVLAPSFGGRRDTLAALKLVGYSLTPAFLAGILGVVPPLALLQLIAALWALYVFAVGAPIVVGVARDKAIVYTVVYAVCALVFGFVASALLAATAGGMGAAVALSHGFGFGGHLGAVGSGSDSSARDEKDARAMLSGMVGAAMGGNAKDRERAQQMVDAVASAGADAEKTQNNDDPAAKAQAGANILKAIVGGGGPKVTPVSRDALRSLLPNSAAGLPRRSSDAQAQTIAGISGTSAGATYGEAGGSSLDLKVGDLGNAGGLTAIAGMGMNLVANSENDEGYEKTLDVDGRKVHLTWRNSGKHAELLEIVDNRFALSVDSNGLDVDAALGALRTIDLAKLQSLAAAAHS